MSILGFGEGFSLNKLKVAPFRGPGVLQNAGPQPTSADAAR